jgi:Fe-S-cluster containining protein
MDFVFVVDILLGLIILYLLFVEYLYTRKKFKCLRCGDCCRLIVRLNEEDKKRLKKNGYRNFVDKLGFLKRINGHCIFLGMKNGIAECGIEKIKPEVCRHFPEKRGLFGKKRDRRCRSCRNNFLKH